jgi:hypothetical protein
VSVELLPDVPEVSLLPDAPDAPDAPEVSELPPELEVCATATALPSAEMRTAINSLFMGASIVRLLGEIFPDSRQDIRLSERSAKHWPRCC